MLDRHLVFAAVMVGITPALARADAFDHYVNTILTKIPESKCAEKVTKLTKELMAQNGRVLPGITAAFIVVKTNEGRFAKLLVQPARQKITADVSAPIVLIERYVTYKEGEERTIHASGQNLRLFSGFRLNLDIGQVVPNQVPADLRVIVDQDDFYLEPVDKAEIYLVTKQMPEAKPGQIAEIGRRR